MTTYGDDRGEGIHYVNWGPGFGFGTGIYRDENTEYCTVNDNFGAWDTLDGKRKYGFEQNGQVWKSQAPIGDGTTLESEAASFNYGINDDGSTFSMGAQANLYGAGLVHKESDPNSDGDRTVRAGFSEGVGAGARVHHGDEDGDGHREWGLGFDAGPVSFDYKTENPAELLLAPGAFGPMMGIGLVDFLDDSEHEQLQEAQPIVADTGADVVDSLEAAAEYVPDVVDEYIPEAAETVEEVEECIEEYAPTPENVYSWIAG